jgi:hypothetical protein
MVIVEYTNVGNHSKYCVMQIDFKHILMTTVGRYPLEN